jgi:phosphoglycerate dehydrogenase-like enzyme
MKRKALFLLGADAFHRIFGPRQMEAIRDLVEILDPLPGVGPVPPGPDVLGGVQLLFGGWGTPALTAALLDQMPRLEAVFYGAGSIRAVTTEAFWGRGIPITSSYAANAVPVAEFAEAQIILALKRAWSLAAAFRETRRQSHEGIAGAYGSTVGLVSLGMIGQLLARRLQSHELRVLAYDPFYTQEQADALKLQVSLCSLETLFAESEVVSLHAPSLPATRGLVTRRLLASLKPHATFINTARGAVVDEPGLIEVLQQRPDLMALLDVTDPEPPAPGAPLYTLPNVFLTPHIAGSLAGECARMGELAVGECRRFLAGESLRWAIPRAQAERMA